jgi:hypothetical protein
MDRRSFVLGLPFALAGCGAPSVWAPDEEVMRAVYRHDGPPMITLFTMKGVKSGYGAHTSLMINASQRVVFDPAGSLVNAEIPERNDVLFGITPRVEDFYIGYHARTTYFVVRQDKEVAPEVAELALQLAVENGPVPRSACTLATSSLLSKLPGFERINSTLLPDRLEMRFGELPGVVTQEYRDYDPDQDRSAEIAEFQATPETAVTGVSASQ